MVLISLGPIVVHWFDHAWRIPAPLEIYTVLNYVDLAATPKL